MKKTNLLILLFVAVISGLFLFRPNIQSPAPKAINPVEIHPNKIIVSQKIIGNGKVIENQENIEVDSGNTVLDVLIKTNNPQIKEYSFGKAVESIGDLKNGDQKKYWIYSVNEKEATIGAGAYYLSPNDKITWEFK